MDDQTKSNEVVISGVVKTHRFRPSLNGQNQSKLLVAVAIAVIAAIGLAIFLHIKHNRDNQVYIKAGGVTITHKQYDTMKPQAYKDEKTSASLFKNRLATMVERRAAAKQLKVTPSDHEIATGADMHYQKHKNLDDWQQYVAYDEALNLAVQRLQQGGISGAIFEFPFDRLFTSDADPLPHENDPAYIAKDKQYALGQAQAYYVKLAQHKLSDGAVIKQIMADKSLNSDIQQNQSQILSANSNAWADPLGFYATVAPNIFGLSRLGLSSIQTGRIARGTLSNGQPQTVDAYFYFYHITEIVKPQAKVPQQFGQEVGKQMSHALISVPSGELK